MILPNLDDRRYADLVEEAISVIPLYAPSWTNFNASDPGITVVELLAWITEMRVYGINRIPEALRRKFLGLVGVVPAMPAAARTFLSLEPFGPSPVHVAAGVEFSAVDTAGEAITFRAAVEMTAVPIRLIGALVEDAAGMHDILARLRGGQLIQLFGPNPQPGAAVYLGFDGALPVAVPLSLYFQTSDDNSAERGQLIAEAEAHRQSCNRTRPCPRGKTEPPAPPAVLLPAHHSAQVVWEFHTAAGWTPFDTAQILDETRSLTLSGRVVVTCAGVMDLTKPPGADVPSGYYIRCRFVAGAFDDAPAVRSIVHNAILADQSAAWLTTYELAKDAQVNGVIPAPGGMAGFTFQLDSTGHISRLNFGDMPGVPQFRIIESPGPSAPRLSFEALYLGTSDGLPSLKLPIAPGTDHWIDMASGPALYTLETSSTGAQQWQAWSWMDNLDTASPGSFAATIDPVAGIVRFGEGDRGQISSAGAMVFLVARQTSAVAGNIDARAITSVADSPSNRLDPSFNHLRQLSVLQPNAAAGGTAGETVLQASAGVARLREAVTRAATIGDIKQLAIQTPGTRIARASAMPGVSPLIPGENLPGVVTLVVLPHLPLHRPMPSAGLLRAVRTFLGPRRILGTALYVIGPTYVTVTVHAKIVLKRGAGARNVIAGVIAALDGFFDPLGAAPDADPWPFGRDVYSAEVLQVIAATSGVDYVASLEISRDGGPPQCGNLCVGRFGLVDSGTHVIETTQG